MILTILNIRRKFVFKMKTRIRWGLACPQLNLSILRINIDYFLLLLIIILYLIFIYNFSFNILLPSFNLFFLRWWLHSLIIKFCRKSLSILDAFLIIYLKINSCFLRLWNLVLILRFLFAFTIFIFSVLFFIFRLTFLNLLILIRQL